MRALVVGNAEALDSGFVGLRLRQRGYAFVECVREDPEGWPGLDGIELVLTLGSEWNVYGAETAACVEAESTLVRQIVARDIPLLAICFGAQVLSHALGATVARNATPEIGWFDFPVAAPVATGPWMEWHDDMFTEPEGFDVLARTDAGPQLIRGGRCLATQFHPEVTETMIASWLAAGGADQHRRYGGDPAQLMAATRANVERSRPNAAALVDWFLDDVAAR
jgi:GMP synthase-like glutamine amidotransferase